MFVWDYDEISLSHGLKTYWPSVMKVEQNWAQIWAHRMAYQQICIWCMKLSYVIKQCGDLNTIWWISSSRVDKSSSLIALRCHIGIHLHPKLPSYVHVIYIKTHPNLCSCWDNDAIKVKHAAVFQLRKEVNREDSKSISVKLRGACVRSCYI